MASRHPKVEALIGLFIWCIREMEPVSELLLLKQLGLLRAKDGFELFV
jgi:hypothetical protein